jgi:hypothetical protein
MASTSCALRNRVEDTEIFQVLQDSTDSDVTIFSSEEDEDGNDPTVMKMDNWMTILKQMKMEAVILETQKLII